MWWLKRKHAAQILSKSFWGIPNLGRHQLSLMLAVLLA
jgi:hypothetical protein